MDFNSIGGTITQRSKVSDMSARDKVNLFRYLMTEIGITKKLLENSLTTGVAIKIMDDQINLYWNN